MKTGKEGLTLIKLFEGCKLVAYLCPAGVWTIGYGTTRYSKKVIENGKEVIKRVPVEKGMKITQEQAEFFLADDLSIFEDGVSKLVIVKTSQNQFDALVCFSYNVGLGALEKSTLLKHLNKGAFELAANEFLKWNKANGKELAGLTNRRKAERNLFLAKVV